MNHSVPYLTTASGQRYRLTGPELDTPRIGDIAHHLAQINRFTGAASRPYSVAEHSLLCEQIAASEGAGPLGRMCALMHDAHEAYCSDASSPAKQAMRHYTLDRESDYDLFEYVHAGNVRRAFGLLPAFIEHRHDVRRWDLIALATERRDLMPMDSDEWEILRGVEALTRGVWSFKAENTWTFWRAEFKAKFDYLNWLINS